jgi:amino acid permease
MSFPYSYSVLGLVPGLILTVVVAALVLYTSLVLWEFCLRHPEVRDVCDIGQMLFWGKTWAWYATAVCFILNNTFIQVYYSLHRGIRIPTHDFRVFMCLSVPNI